MPKGAKVVLPVRTGRLLAIARQLAGLSQTEVAEKIGCSQSNITQIERSSHTEPKLDTLKQLSELYDLNFEDVVASLVFDKYGIDFSSSFVPQNLRIVIAERKKEKVDEELGLP